MDITIQTKPQPDGALYLRREIASGTSPDGTRVEIALSGATLVLQHQLPDQERTVHTISVSDLLVEWARVIDQEKGGSA